MNNRNRTYMFVNTQPAFGTGVTRLVPSTKNCNLLDESEGNKSHEIERRCKQNARNCDKSKQP